ncbi:hypothetical protein FA013_04075 [Raoultella planticola]|nr:hypothetical protein FA013_04075 [Raoultella planticola]
MSAVITFSFVCVKITTCWFKYKIDYIFITNRNKWYTRHTLAARTCPSKRQGLALWPHDAVWGQRKRWAKRLTVLSCNSNYSGDMRKFSRFGWHSHDRRVVGESRCIQMKAG